MNTLEHTLILLMEEAGEIQQAASKCLRFGIETQYQEQEPNIIKLHQELADLDAVRKLLENICEPPDLTEHRLRKLVKIKHYMNESKERGLLT